MAQSIALLLEEAKRKNDEKTLQGINWLIERRLEEIDRKERQDKEFEGRTLWRGLIEKDFGKDYVDRLSTNAPSNELQSLYLYERQNRERAKTEAEKNAELLGKIAGNEAFVKKWSGEKALPSNYNELPPIQKDAVLSSMYPEATERMRTQIAPEPKEPQPPSVNFIKSNIHKDINDINKSIKENKDNFKQYIEDHPEIQDIMYSSSFDNDLWKFISTNKNNKYAKNIRNSFNLGSYGNNVPPDIKTQAIQQLLEYVKKDPNLGVGLNKDYKIPATTVNARGEDVSNTIGSIEKTYNWIKNDDRFPEETKNDIKGLYDTHINNTSDLNDKILELKNIDIPKPQTATPSKGTEDNPFTPQTQEDYNTIPVGAYYMQNDTLRIKK